jgi:CheY-like chemotaxis protein
MVMPGMGGKDTCIEIKRTPNPPKVLICTGYSELADLESILGKHADGLLQKPYNTNDMASAVENLLSYTSQ